MPMVTVLETAGTLGISRLGGIDILQDITQGRWGVLVAKGAIAGIMAVPVVRGGIKWIRENRESSRMDREEEKLHREAGAKDQTQLPAKSEQSTGQSQNI